MISKSVTDQVAKIVEGHLKERFKDEFVFDPIIVRPQIDHDGDEYLDIFIVFSGDQKKLDPDWTLGLVPLITTDLIELGVSNVPSKSFVEKSEWETIYHGKYPRA